MCCQQAILFGCGVLHGDVVMIRRCVKSALPVAASCRERGRHSAVSYVCSLTVNCVGGNGSVYTASVAVNDRHVSRLPTVAARASDDGVTFNWQSCGACDQRRRRWENG